MFMVVPPKRLYIMQGIPGSGKSTLARMIRDQVMASSTTTVSSIILSTDDYWVENAHEIANTYSEGHAVKTTYKFDPAKLGDAHAWNQRRTVQAMQSKTNYIFIDNTNIKKQAAAPYITMADMYGYDFAVVRVDVPLSVCISRNAQRDFNRRVPKETIEKMFADMEQLV